MVNENRMKAEMYHLERLKINAKPEERSLIMQEQQIIKDFEIYDVNCDSEFVQVPKTFQVQLHRVHTKSRL